MRASSALWYKANKDEFRFRPGIFIRDFFREEEMSDLIDPNFEPDSDPGSRVDPRADLRPDDKEPEGHLSERSSSEINYENLLITVLISSFILLAILSWMSYSDGRIEAKHPPGEARNRAKRNQAIAVTIGTLFLLLIFQRIRK